MSVEHDEGGEEVLVRPPAHPVPSLQGPFEESMVESVNDASENDVPIDALTRRAILLDSAYYQRVVAGRWKQKPGEKYHPLWKLVAQMSFGLHLLARNMAKSEDEVMRILQAHVDDIDGFLERTAEDFDLAQDDMQERLKCLRLPLQHGEIFDRMLEDGAFRASILDGNEKIEHIVRRTKRALKDALKDVQKGFDASNVLDKYLANLSNTWVRESPEHEAVLVAMLGNVEGWRRAFMELHLQGNKLAGTLKKLTEVVGEMERRAASVSRDIVAKTRSTSSPLNQAQTPAGARVSVQKPLPGPPGKRNSTRGSSRSTHFLDHSSARNSGDMSSESRPHSNTSQTPSGRQTPSTILTTSIMDSTDSAKDGTTRRGALPTKASPIQEDWQNEIPIELPADVPEEVMRNAPVSVKNRLSMTLGLKPRDTTDHRISSIYYPKALGDLLKISQSPPYKASPQLVAARGTAIRSNSPHTDSEADYFSAHERSPSIGHITPETKKFLDSGLTTPENIIPRIAVRSPTVPPENLQRQSALSNPGLTSHPSVMQMASPPAELSALAETVEVALERPASRSRQESQSSLGEPGPEIAETGLEADSNHQADVEIPVVDAKGPEEPAEKVHELDVEPVPLDVVEPQPSVVDTHNDENAKGDRTAKDALENETPEEKAESHNVLDEASESKPQDVVENNALEVEPEKPSTVVIEEKSHEEKDVQVVEATDAADAVPSSDEDIDKPANEDTITTFIAELEAVAPERPTRPVTMQPTSPIELEAPVQTFVLPPRSKAKMSQGKDWSSATIKDRADFFKLPNEQSVKPGMKPRDFRGTASQDPGPVRPLKLKLAKFDGKLVPVQVHTPPKDKPDTPVRTSRLSQDIIANLIEQISHTPPGSPGHSRAGSGASSSSAQIRAERAPQSFAPPDSAPAPPGPGGRSMVNPDYASIGQFDGERRHSKRSSRGSKGGIKDILSGSRRNSSDSSAKSPGHSSRVQSISARGSGSDMLTSAGKDVLWFKEEGQTAPVGVSSST